MLLGQSPSSNSKECYWAGRPVRYRATGTVATRKECYWAGRPVRYWATGTVATRKECYWAGLLLGGWHSCYWPSSKIATGLVALNVARPVATKRTATGRLAQLGFTTFRSGQRACASKLRASPRRNTAQAHRSLAPCCTKLLTTDCSCLSCVGRKIPQLRRSRPVAVPCPPSAVPPLRQAAPGCEPRVMRTRLKAVASHREPMEQLGC